jgi:hypothetical protein
MASIESIKPLRTRAQPPPAACCSVSQDTRRERCCASFYTLGQAFRRLRQIDSD